MRDSRLFYDYAKKSVRFHLYLGDFAGEEAISSMDPAGYPWVYVLLRIERQVMNQKLAHVSV
jgi:hypothetical protein